MGVSSPVAAVGLTDIKYAVLTSDNPDGVPVYGPVKSLPGARALAYNSAASLTSFYADNQVWSLSESTGDKGITVTLVDADPEKMAEIMGHTYANGSIVKKESDVSPYLAIWGKKTYQDGSYAYVRYYKVLLGKPSSEDATREASDSPREVSFEGRVASLQSSTYKGYYIDTCVSNDTNANAAYLAAFNGSVTFPTGATGAVTVAAAAGAAGQVVFTFTKAAGTTAMSQGTFVKPNIQIFLNSTGAVQSPTWTFGATGATQTATASGCTAGASQWLVSDLVKDVNGVGVTAKGGTVTVG